MTTWYQATPSSWSTLVEPVEIEDFTIKTVTINGRRRLRMTSYRCYFPTQDKAWAHLQRRAETSVDMAERKLEQERMVLNKIISGRKESV